MILHFPQIHTLQLALTSGLLPELVVAAPAEFATNEEGRVWVQFPVELSPGQLSELKPFGIAARKATRSARSELQLVSCWPQILPLEKVSTTSHNGLTERTPVLFELPETANLGEVVSEMLRLGNDRQSFRQQQTPEGVRTLLQVKGPPYYTLLRAIDPLDGAATPKAYIEQSPRVWVEYGYSHPLAELIQPASGTMLLLSHPRQWTAIEEGKFTDIYEVLRFTVPAKPIRWETGQLEERLKVRLRLVRGGSEDPAEFWVLSEKGIGQLEDLVQSSDDRLISRLAFAVGMLPEKPGERVIVVKVRPGKEPPPVLVLDGISCRSYLRIPNLFLPQGYRLHPPLRRDAVKQLLAADVNQNTWLLPQADGQFIPQSLPDNAFRPLPEWVDYVLDSDREALSTWMESMQFDFESFVCHDEAPDRISKSQQQPIEPEAEAPKSRESRRPSKPSTILPTQKRGSSKTRAILTTRPAMMLPPSEVQLKLEALENSFREMPEPLDSPRREELWRELAELNLALGNHAQGAICHVNGLWEQPALAVEWIRDWYDDESDEKQPPPLTGDYFQTILSAERPTPAQLNRLAIHVICAAFGDETPLKVSSELLGRAQLILERFEYFLPVRLAWLAWLGLAKLSQNDLLLLARSRDRILERLYQQGPSPELDLPSFLRSSGPREGERFREVQEALRTLRGRIASWIQRELEERGTSGTGQTAAYADMMLAYGYSRVGLSQECLELVKNARSHLLKGSHQSVVHEWLFEAFQHRIQQSLQGENRVGTLPEHLMKPLIDKTIEPTLVFIIDSLRSRSAILQPIEEINSHARFLPKGNSFRLADEVEHLSDIENRVELAARIRELLDQYGGQQSLEGPPDAKPTSPIVFTSARLPSYQVLLSSLLPLAPRLGEAHANELLSEVHPTLLALTNPCQQAVLLDKALFVAAHFGHAVHVRHCLEQLYSLFEHFSSSETAGVFGELLGQSFRGLRKLGMRDAISRLLEQIDKLLENEQFEAPAGSVAKSKGPKSVKSLGSRNAKALERQFDAMTLRLNLASGWFYFGNDERAKTILGEVSAFLYREQDLPQAHRRKLARRYASALEHAPAEVAIPKLNEVFDKLRKITKGFGAGMQDQYYAYEVLEVIESVILALVSDDMTLDPKARRLMEELELATRRRIHRDMESARHQSEIFTHPAHSSLGAFT